MPSSCEAQHIRCTHGRLSWREAGSGPALVLLHGIGGGALSWVAQLEAFAATHRVIAWDAPGYAQSDPLPQPRPMAVDYARALAELTHQLGLQQFSLVGHSLGALMAAAFAASLANSGPRRMTALLLASPAQGYGSAPAELQQAKWQERVAAVQQLGVEKLASERSAKLCAPGTAASVIEQVRANMARITPGGYSQAAHLLAHDDIAGHLGRVTAPITVLCGELDRVTPPAACRALAAAHRATYVALPDVAHVCYAEQPAQFNAALTQALNGALNGALSPSLGAPHA